MTAKIDISVTALPRGDRGDGPVTAREFWPGDFFPTHENLFLCSLFIKDELFNHFLKKERSTTGGPNVIIIK